MYNENEKLIKKFLDYKKNHNGHFTKRTFEIKEGIIKRFFKEIDKDIKKINDKEISKFLSKFQKLSTRNLNLITLREFYRWYYKLEKKDQLPDCIKDFEIATENAIRRQQTKERMITEQEYKELLNGFVDPQYKAIVQLQWTTGARISEILSINSDGVQDEGKLIYITVKKSKTKTRTVPIPTDKYNVDNIIKWAFEYQPFKDKKDKPMFVGKRTKKRLEARYFGEILTKTSKKIIGRNITTHDFRHTSITRDRESGMPNSIVEAKHGLEHGSRMMKVYDHNGVMEVKNYYSSKMNIEETREPLEKIKKERDKVKELNKELNELKEKINILEKNTMPSDDEAIKKHIYEVLKQIQEGES